MSECTMCEAMSFAHHLDCPSHTVAMPEGSDPVEYTIIKRDGYFFKIRSMFLMKKCHKPHCGGNAIFTGYDEVGMQYKKGDVYARCDRCNQPFIWELTSIMRKRFNIKK